MRKLKLQVQISVDGFVAGPQGEMDWLTFDWDEEIGQYVEAITDPVDCIVLGRKLAEGFIPHWASVAADEEHPEFAAGQKFSETPKVVFTGTLDRSQWPNTVLAKGDLMDEITRLKDQAGGDIVACGGASFVSGLVQHDLIDEYHLFVNPAALASGMPIFKTLASPRRLVLETVRAFPCGIVLVRYGR
ncbi:MAG: dihydrofolate reductase family protein [Anaerolineae bacterium]